MDAIVVLSESEISALATDCGPINEECSQCTDCPEPPECCRDS